MKYRVWIGKDLLDEEGGLKEEIKNPPTVDEENSDKVEDEIEPIRLSEYEVIGMKVSGFPSPTATSSDNSGNTGVGVKRRPDYKLVITSRIRSTISIGSLMSGITAFAEKMKMTPTAEDIRGGKITTTEKKVKDTYKIKSWDDGFKVAGLVAGSGIGAIGDLSATANNSAENCIRMKEWFNMYKEDEKETSSESGESGEKKMTSKVYRDIYIEVVLSDVQSFYYHFPNMYIDKFDEDYTDQEGTCKYTIELLSYYHEDKGDNVFKHEKVSYGSKLNNGFKKLLNYFGLGRRTSVTGGLNPPDVRGKS